MIVSALIPAVLTEAVLGGGGRTFSVGSLSLRMLLFALGVTTWLATVLFSPRQRDGVALAVLMVIGLFVSLGPGLLVDIDRGTDLTTISLELQPLLFWVIAPLFAMGLPDEASVRRASSIIIYGGLTVALITVGTLIGIRYGAVSFGTVYSWALRTSELFFRSGGSFFYKGHFYVGVAFIFCLILLPKRWQLMLLVLLASIAMSLTRGLYLAVAVASVLSFLSTRRSFAMILTVLLGVAVVVFFGDALLDVFYDPSRLISADTRTRDFAAFQRLFDYRLLLFGEGTGVLLNGRQNIENSFVWAIWRFGIVGLVFWMTPLYLSARYYFRLTIKDAEHQLASAFFFGIVFLYIATLSNPFINNSIGMTYALLAVFALRRLSLGALARSRLAAPGAPAPV